MNDSEPIETTAIAVRAPMSVGQAMSVDEIVAQVNLVHKVMEKVMQEGTHFGTIPGCGDKKCLLQPGAQKLTMTFRLAPEYEIQETNLDRGHKEYRVVCTLKTMGSGSVVGQGVGCCSSMESKYRFRGGARKCPECGKATIIKGRAEYGGGWLCFAKKGGCGAKWPDGDKAIEGQSEEKIENESPADCHNTVLKMAKKRAFVDATITATAASDIFTQDLAEDDTENNSGAQEGTKPPPAPEKPSRKAPAKESAPKNTAPAPTAEAPKANGMSPEDRAEFINILQDHANKAVKRGVEQLIRFLQTRKTAKGRLLLAQGQTLTDLADADLKSLVNGWNSVLAPFAEFAEMNPPPPVEDAPDFTDKAADDETAPKGNGEPDWLAGAGQAVKDEPRPDQPDDPGDEGLEVEGFKVKGILQAVTVQQGTAARGAWTAHHCHVDGQKYTTFDKKIGEKAVGLKNKPVQIVFERTTKGNGVLSISAA
jgi:hypothetical protein